MQTLNSLIQMLGQEFMDDANIFTILFAAVVHDVKHPGRGPADCQICFRPVTLARYLFTYMFCSLIRVEQQLSRKIALFSGLKSQR